jgi:hypothetical protein
MAASSLEDQSARRLLSRLTSETIVPTARLRAGLPFWQSL